MDDKEVVLFSEDEDAENHGNAIRNIQLSPKKMSRDLDKQLFSLLMADKEKPRDDILSTEVKEEDPYAEFDNLDEHAPEIPTPEQECKPFQPAGRVVNNTPVTPHLVRRQRRLEQLAKAESVLRKVKVEIDDEDEYIPQSVKRRRLNGDSSNDPENDENVTPRSLRPRKTQGNEDDDIPLSVLRKKLLNEKEKNTPLNTGSKKSSSKVVDEDDIPLSALRNRLLREMLNNTPLTQGSRKISSRDVPEVFTPKSTRRRVLPRKLFSKNGSAAKEKKRKYSNTSSECSPVDNFRETKAKRKKLSPENAPPPSGISAANDSADADESDEEYTPYSRKKNPRETHATPTEEERTTRSRLRPRKSAAWLDDDLIPLSVLKKSLTSAKKEETMETDQLVSTPVATTA